MWQAWKRNWHLSAHSTAPAKRDTPFTAGGHPPGWAARGTCGKRARQAQPTEPLAFRDRQRLKCRLEAWRGRSMTGWLGVIAASVIAFVPQTALSHSAPAKQEEARMSQQVKDQLAPTGVLRAGI